MAAILFRIGLVAAAWGAAALPPVAAQDAGAPPPRPVRITEKTQKGAAALALLQKPGRVLFEDAFESDESLERYFEVRGRKDGRAVLVTDVAHGGKGSIRFTAPARDGAASGSGASGWLGAEGHDRLYMRRWILFPEDYDQGDLHHVGGGLAAVAGSGKWDEMGKAGVRPRGDDRFTVSFEPWRAWGRYAPPGYMFCYAYWMDMEKDRDGHFWGNMLGPADDARIVPRRGVWTCLEHMVKANSPGEADGEFAAWVDGHLYLHYRGIRWRSSPAVRLKRFDIGIYVHHATRENRVWYDDLVLSTGYVGLE